MTSKNQKIHEIERRIEREEVMETPLLPAWDDLRIAASVTTAGVTATVWGTFLATGPLRSLHFETRVDQEVSFEIQMPHDYLQGSDVYPHVHWCPTSTAAGNVLWGLEFSWANMNDAFPAPTTYLTTGNSAGTTAWTHILSRLTSSDGLEYIDGTGKTLSSMISCRLYRNGSATSVDTYGADAALLEFDLHYQKDSFGS